MSKISFKKGTRGEKKRKEIAEAILADNPNIPEDRKFAIATAQAKKSLRKKRRKKRAV